MYKIILYTIFSVCRVPWSAYFLKCIFLMDKLVLVGKTKREAKLEGFPKKAEFSLSTQWGWLSMFWKQIEWNFQIKVW